MERTTLNIEPRHLPARHRPSLSLTYDSDGNQLADEAGNVLVYDAWDRNVGWYNPDTSGYIDVVYVFDEEGNPAVSNPYDALGRRVSSVRRVTRKCVRTIRR